MTTEQPKPSGLPPLTDVREQITMRIITINTKPFTRKLVKTSLFLQEQGGKPYSLLANLIHVDDPQTKSFMPTKVWADEWDPARRNGDLNFNILYYINTTLPQAVKPFKDNTYLMYFIPGLATVEYDVTVRFFMDQIQAPFDRNQMIYVMMFGDESYKDIVLEEKQ